MMKNMSKFWKFLNFLEWVPWCSGHVSGLFWRCFYWFLNWICYMKLRLVGALRVFLAETRLTVYRQCQFSHFSSSIRSYKSMFFLWSRVINAFLAITFDELSYFYTHEAWDAFKTAGKGMSWTILYNDFLWTM